MRILFAGNKERGRICLEAIIAAGHTIVGIILHPGNVTQNCIADTIKNYSIPIFHPENVNDPSLIASLIDLKPEIVVLAGYGKIVGNSFLSIAQHGCINLHGGKLPEFRGSSPMNWALIRGENQFTISIIQVDEGVDTGDILIEKTFPIGRDDTILELQECANREFPGLLCTVLNQIQNRTVKKILQESSKAAYYPLRFPDDGLIIWDTYTAEEIHNRIRALTDPYPGAFTYYNGNKIFLIRSSLPNRPYYGEPGRVYANNSHGLLICAKDSCLWITKAYSMPDKIPVFKLIPRYSTMITLRERVIKNMFL